MSSDLGLVGDGTTDNTAALNAALAGMGPGVTLELEPGDYAFSTASVIGLAGWTLTGAGRLLSRQRGHDLFRLVGCSGFTIDSIAISQQEVTSRSTGKALSLIDCDNYTVSNVTAGPCEEVGIYSAGCHNGTYLDCTVTGTIKDGIHSTNRGSLVGRACEDLIYTNCSTTDTGDDGLACVSYATDGPINRRIAYIGCSVTRSMARGLTFLGVDGGTAQNITIDQTDIHGVWIGEDTGYATWGSSNVALSDLTITGAGQYGNMDPGVGLLMAPGPGDPTYGVTGVTADRVTIANASKFGLSVEAPSGFVTTDVAIRDLSVGSISGANHFAVHLLAAGHVTIRGLAMASVTASVYASSVTDVAITGITLDGATQPNLAY